MISYHKIIQYLKEEFNLFCYCILYFVRCTNYHTVYQYLNYVYNFIIINEKASDVL